MFSLILCHLNLLLAVCTVGYCLNGGICKPVNKKPTCICQTGYSGPRCGRKTSKILLLFISTFALIRVLCPLFWILICLSEIPYCLTITVSPSSMAPP